MQESSIPKDSIQEDLIQILEVWTKYKYLNTINPMEKKLEDWLFTIEDALIDMGIDTIEISEINDDSYVVTFSSYEHVARLSFDKTLINNYLC